MPAEIRIREARPDDIATITRIYANAVLHSTASFEVQPPDTEEMLRRRAVLLNRDMPYLVAEIGGQLAGYAYASQFRARSAYRSTVENSVYVDDLFHRRGVGRALMQRLIHLCSALAMAEMIAVVGDPASNRGSVGLHRSLGFEVVGIFRGIGEKFGQQLDVMMLQKSL
jgi:L-amino acid N-acyltransferase YncA